MENNNNNNDNLFTQMFGLESEQPPTPLPKEEVIPEQPKIENTTNIVPNPSIESPKPEIFPTQVTTTEQIFQTDLATQLNRASEESSNITVNQEQTVTITPTKQDEIIELTDAPIKKEEKEEQVSEVKFNPNAIPTEPFEYKPSQSVDYDEPLENASSKSVIFKVLLIFIGVGLLIGGWILFYNVSLDKKDNPIPEQQAEKSEDIKEPEIKQINFDQSLSFYKGLTDNPEELNREYPFEPEETTGVIKCDLIKPISSDGITINIDVYLYYEKNLLKKSYIEQITNIKDKKLFNENIKSTATFEENFKDTEALTIDSKSDYSTQTITVGMFSNLAYGSYTHAAQDGMYYKLKLEYDDSIKTAMATVYGMDGMLGNIKCSSVKTS